MCLSLCQLGFSKPTSSGSAFVCMLVSLSVKLLKADFVRECVSLSVKLLKADFVRECVCACLSVS